MNFVAPKNHSIRRESQTPRLFWSKSGHTTLRMMRLAFTEEAGKASKMKVKDKDGKMVERWVFRPAPRVEEAREYCHALFSLYAHFLGVTKSQVVHAFISDSTAGLHRAWCKKSKNIDTPLNAFIEICQGAWDKATGAMLEWGATYKGMAIHMENRYRTIAKERPMPPERMALIYKNNYTRATNEAILRSIKNVEEAVRWAYSDEAVALRAQALKDAQAS